MRIISFLAAAAVAATVGSPVPAQSSGSMIRGPSHAAGPQGALSPLRRSHPDFQRGMVDNDWRHRDRRRGRHQDRFGRGDETFVYPYGFADFVDRIDPHGNGFFAGAGGEIRMRGGRPYYDYDRSYPYQWAPASSGSAGWTEAEDEGRSASPCSVERAVRVCRGRR